MSSIIKTKSDYLQLSSSHSYDSSQSPLALLAQTCSSIGKDCPSSSSTSIMTKSSSNSTSITTKSSSNSDKSYSSTKRSLNSTNTNKKSTIPLKMNSSFVESNHFFPQFDSTTSLATLLFRSSQQQSYSPTCLHCETIQRILQPYGCHCITCHARFRLNDQLIEHSRSCHRSSKFSNHHRFHPYLKPSRMININDQLPFFYPHLSLSPMTEITRHTNNKPDNNN